MGRATIRSADGRDQVAAMIVSRPAMLAAAAIVAAPFLIAAGIAVAAEGSGSLSSQTTAAQGALPSGCPALASAGAAGLDAEQTANARIIYDVAVSMSLPSQAAIVAIATAMQESRLRNLPYGDRDSLGLFQQRPSQGWGTPAQIMNPAYSTTTFYRALVQMPGWQQLPVTVAAQAVQHSGYPGAYAQWQPIATSLVGQFTGTADQCRTDSGVGVATSGSVRLPVGYSIPPNTPPSAAIAVTYAIAQLGKSYVWGGTGPDGFDCSGLTMMAYRAAGIDLPRTTFQQVLVGTPLYGISYLQAGDLLFTAGSDGTATDPGHVGMFIGNGLVIDAPQTGQFVHVTPVKGYWTASTVAIRRIA